MANYTIIADIGKGISNLLKEKLVPKPIKQKENIGICQPKERGEYILGIHPYDIREMTTNKNDDPVILPNGSLQDAPVMLELYYMITVNSPETNLEKKALKESEIIGRAMQVLKDNKIIPGRHMPDHPGMPIESVDVTSLNLSMEEKVKIWTMFGESYRLSAFYMVGPVVIESENLTKPKTRVRQVVLSSSQYVAQKRLEFETRLREEDIDDEYSSKPDEDDLPDEIEEDEDTTFESDDSFDTDSDLDSDSDIDLDDESDSETAFESSDE